MTLLTHRAKYIVIVYTLCQCDKARRQVRYILIAKHETNPLGGSKKTTPEGISTKDSHQITQIEDRSASCVAFSSALYNNSFNSCPLSINGHYLDNGYHAEFSPADVCNCVNDDVALHSWVLSKVYGHKAATEYGTEWDRVGTWQCCSAVQKAKGRRARWRTERRTVRVSQMGR